MDDPTRQIAVSDPAPPDLRAVFEHAGVGVAVVDMSGHPVMTNPALQAMLGYSGAELASMVFTEFTHPDDADADWGLFSELVAGVRDRYRMDKRYLARDGRLVWGRLTVSLVRDASGEPSHAIGMVEDVTEARQAELALAEAEERYRTLVEELPAVVYIDEGDDVASAVYVSPHYERVLGYTPAERLADPELWIKRLHPEDRSRVLEAHHVALANDAPFEEEYRMLAKDGRVVWVRDRAVPVKGSRRSYRQGILIDVTEAKEAEEELRRQAKRLSDLHALDLAILQACSFEEIARTALARIREVIDCDRASLSLLDLARGRATVAAVDGDEELGPPAGTVIDVHETLEAAELSPGRVVLVPDLQVPADLPSELDEARRRGIRSVLAVQLGGDRTSAVLTLNSRTPDAFTPHHREIAVEVASLLAIALEQARMREEISSSLERARASDELRRRLLVSLVDAQERERRRIAEDLHDDPVQQMTAVGLRLGSLARRLTRDEEVSAALAQLGRTVEVAIGRLRAVMFDLHPPALDRDGLAEAIRQHLDRHPEGTACEIEDAIGRRPIPREVAATAYRIALEALANARRHADASLIRLHLAIQEQGLLVRISDDGVGFTLEEAQARPGHLGLATMRERTQMAGGWLSVDGRPGRGTTVAFWLPLDAAAAIGPPPGADP
jgi:PAS domain S-box-containing protein